MGTGDHLGSRGGGEGYCDGAQGTARGLGELKEEFDDIADVPGLHVLILGMGLWFASRGFCAGVVAWPFNRAAVGEWNGTNNLVRILRPEVSVAPRVSSRGSNRSHLALGNHSPIEHKPTSELR